MVYYGFIDWLGSELSIFSVVINNGREEHPLKGYGMFIDLFSEQDGS